MANPRPRQPKRSGQAASAGSSVTSRALAVLGAFDSDRPSLTLSEIARRSDLPVATTYRLVGELVDWGALQRKGNDYMVGHRLWQLGLLAPVNHNIAEIAAPYMQDVLFVTKNIVNLFVLDGDRVLLLERILGTRVGSPFRRVGDHLPLHASAAGKAILAFGDPTLMESATQKMDKLTEHTLTSPEQLRREVARVRETGYAVSNQEAGDRNFGVAVPIISMSGRCTAALGVVSQEAPNRIGEVEPVLRITARRISRRMGVAMDE